MVERFVAPRFELVGKRVAELPFSGTVAAGGTLTLVSGMITYFFRIKRVKMIITDDANNLITHQWFVSSDPSVADPLAPSGTDIFMGQGAVATFTGKAIIRNVDCNIEVRQRSTYLKLFVVSTSPYAYFVNGTMTVEVI